MNKPGKKSSFVVIFLKDLIVLVPFFLLSFYLVREPVPSNVPFWINFWGFITALMMTSVAWIALQMFKAVLYDQIAQRDAAKSSL